MKHILFLCSSHGFEDGRVSQKEAVSLTRLGYKVSMCGQRAQWKYDHPVVMIDVDSGDVVPDWHNAGFPPVASRMTRIKRLRMLWKVAKREKADLHVAHEFESACLAYLYKKIYKTPYVFDVHEGFDDNLYEDFPKFFHPLIRFVMGIFIRAIVKNSSGITAASSANTFYEYAEKINKPHFVLHNAPFVEYFPFSEEEKKPILIVHEGGLGRIRGSKQIAEALCILSKTHDFRFMILGKISSQESRKEFFDIIEQGGISNRIDDHGPMPWKEFGAVESTGQIGIICSQRHLNHYRSLANKLYNYMACGLCVLAMKDSEAEKIINNSNSGICVDTTNPQAIAKGLAYLIDHPEERRQFARNGRKAIEDRYGWHCMEQLMGKFYGEILNKGVKK